jgi:hypothetical protein
MMGAINAWNRRFPYLAVSARGLIRFAIFIVVATTFVLLTNFLPDSVLNPINAVAWVLGNILLAYAFFAIIVFLIAYALIYDPSSTTAGRLIYRFMLSIVGISSLVFIGIFIDPSPDRAWYAYPAASVENWRPVLRLLIYGYVAFTISDLARLLVLRKWFPHMVTTARDLVTPRHDNTGSNKIAD